MIKSKEWSVIIIREFPSFRPFWEEQQLDSGDIGLCFDLMEFSNFAYDNLLDPSSVRIKLYGLIEEFIISGEPALSTAIATCFLESLINTASNDKGRDVQNLFLGLGPKSLEFCRALDDFTGVKTAGISKE